MKRTAIWTACVSVLLVAVAAAQTQEEYIDIFSVKVKPEKRAQFDAVTKKFAAANRQNKGDAWLTTETVYGDGNRVTFASFRTSYGDIEKGMEAFMGSLAKSLGQAGMQKVFDDFGACVESSRGEFRRRRRDLSTNPPADAAAMAQMLGAARWLRTTAVHVRPGKIADFEALLKEYKTAAEKVSPRMTVLVSQAVAGQEGTVFYITALRSSLSAFDDYPSVQKILGDDGYEKYLKNISETVAGSETTIGRFMPELSNVPAAVAAVAPDYWTPKPAVTAKPKAGAAKKEE